MCIRDSLEAAMQNSIKNQNIEMMYEILDTMLVLDLEEEKTNKIYDEILKVATLNLEEKLEKNELLKLENIDFLTIRAFYELAIEKLSLIHISEPTRPY